MRNTPTPQDVLENLKKHFTKSHYRNAEHTFNMISKLVRHCPPCLKVVVIPGKSINSNISKTSSGNSIKEERYYLAKNGQQNLKRMGIKGQDLQSLITDGTIITHDRNERYDITIEHQKDLGRGGRRSSMPYTYKKGQARKSNTYLLPSYLNHLFGWVSNQQMNIAPDAQHHIGFTPKPVNGQIPAVPYIPKGFRKTINLGQGNKQINEARVKELFKVDFQYAPKLNRWR